jgi:hypothetical protein
VAEDDIIAADPEALKRGGVNLEETAAIALRAYNELKDACAHFAYAGGHGDKIAKAFHKTYDPGQESGLEFLKMLHALLTGDGVDVNAAGVVLGNADANATHSAGSGGKRG